MLNKHDPAIFGHHKIEDFFNLRGAVPKSIFHNFPSNMTLLVWKQNNARGFNIRAFQRFDSPAKPVVEYAEANDSSVGFIDHVSTLVLRPRA